MTICIIPARSGSKRIRNKNIKKIGNKHLITHVINTAKASKIFDKIIVSTDSKKIANIAKKAGAVVPFLRQKKLSGDNVETSKVLIDIIQKLNLKEKYFFCIYPTAVLLKKKNLIEAFFKIKKKNFDRLIAVKKFESSPLRGFKIHNNKIKYLNKKFYNSRTQDLSNFYQDSGTFYIFKTRKYLKNSHKPANKTTHYELDRFTGVNIDSYDDLKLVKIFFNYRKKKF